VSYCAGAYPIIKEVQARLGERLRFVFRNFPIATSHPHADSYDLDTLLSALAGPAVTDR
jgi:hypothetical protein